MWRLATGTCRLGVIDFLEVGVGAPDCISLRPFADPVKVRPPLRRCDHTSVGVLIYNDDGDLLIVERASFPYGLAVPAGHVDAHGSYEQAALAEAREELGLRILNLKFVAEGRRENPCRRLGGDWHNWKIFSGQPSGEFALDRREIRCAEWCNQERLAELASRRGGEVRASRKLLGVWLDWFHDLGVIDRCANP